MCFSGKPMIIRYLRVWPLAKSFQNVSNRFRAPKEHAIRDRCRSRNKLDADVGDPAATPASNSFSKLTSYTSRISRIAITRSEFFAQRIIHDFPRGLHDL